jgi:hypothetical protein
MVLSVLVGAGGAAAKPVFMPNVVKAIQKQRAAVSSSRGIYLHAPPCPESGLLPQIPGAPVNLGNCGIPEAPATTLPYLTPMVYWGGHVQTHPHLYLVFWGWGQSGAFPKQNCTPETITEGSLSATLPCDPDGAGKYMADFLAQLGGTRWAGVQTQYFETGPGGKQSYVTNDRNQLAGMWVDDSIPANFEKTLYTNKAGPTNTFTLLGAEATNAAAHFGVSGSDLIDSNFIIVQPPGLSDPNAISLGYCAFHDYTIAESPGNSYYKYPTVGRGIAYSNIPYQLAINIAGMNVCGENAVNTDAKGKLDGFSIVLGHEVEEAVTDPGAEAISGNITTGHETYWGAWYDAVDANENGDKCAWVGTPTTQILGIPNLPGEQALFLHVPGAVGNITGNAGGRFAVQSLWSNAAAGGTGYCAGVANSDLPGPLSGEPPYGPETLVPAARRATSAGARSRARHSRAHAVRVRYRVI